MNPRLGYVSRPVRIHQHKQCSAEATVGLRIQTSFPVRDQNQSIQSPAGLPSALEKL